MVSTRQMSGNGVNTNGTIVLSQNIDYIVHRPAISALPSTSTAQQQYQSQQPNQQQQQYQQLLQPCSSISVTTTAPALSLLVPVNYLSTPASSTSTSTAIVIPSTIAAGPSGTKNSSPRPPNLLDMPVEILYEIFSYVGYKKVAHLRTVSPKMNHICSSILNSTFMKLQNYLFHRFQTVKAKMPRRESARRNHPLACECDILETCHMRLYLLQNTFGRHIEKKYCCFFPGGILDEVFSVLNYIKTNPELGRPYKVTDELFDLSTMAIEYFKEHIEPDLPNVAYFNSSADISFPSPTNSDKYLIEQPSPSSSSSSKMPPQSNMVLRKGIRKIKQGMKRYNNELSVLRSELRTCKRKATEQSKQIAEQQKLFAEQQKQTIEYANRLDENDKKNEEISKKFSSLLQELNKCKTELQYWRSKSPATPLNACVSCGQPLINVTPEDIQALVNQGVIPEDLQVLPYMDETSLAGVEEDVDVEMIDCNEFNGSIDKISNDNSNSDDKKSSQEYQLVQFGSIVPNANDIINSQKYSDEQSQPDISTNENTTSVIVIPTKYNSFKRKSENIDNNFDINISNNQVLTSDMNMIQKQLSNSVSLNNLTIGNSNKKIRKVQIKGRTHTNNFNAITTFSSTKTRSNNKKD